MAETEFTVIERYFRTTGAVRDDVALAIGDDAAVLRPAAGQELVMTVDTLVEGVHFDPDVAAADLAWKAVAVNLSDLAAMAAQPAWVMLALTVPRADSAWLAQFATGLAEACSHFGVQLVGGDTTHGPLTVTVQATGLVPAGEACRRDGARPGDRIYVTGTLGDAALALRVRDRALPLEADERTFLDTRLLRPQARVREGLALRGIAHAMIDISDGLAADLGHILRCSAVTGSLGASLRLAELPRSPVLAAVSRRFPEHCSVAELQLHTGDDYELCFTLPAQQAARHATLLQELGCCCIGEIEARAGLRGIDAAGRVTHLAATGYEHFREEGDDR